MQAHVTASTNNALVGSKVDFMTGSKGLEPSQRAGEIEKMTVDVGVVDLGHVDFLVQDGIYSNRSELVRTVVGNQLPRMPKRSSRPWHAAR